MEHFNYIRGQVCRDGWSELCLNVIALCKRDYEKAVYREEVAKFVNSEKDDTFKAVCNELKFPEDFIKSVILKRSGKNVSCKS